MKRIILLSIVLTLAPLALHAFTTDVTVTSDTLAYVAMPLAVSSVCDVHGVQRDRVGRLVTYMDQANVAPADFVDVFRYVPVALVMRTDGRPDFVEWVHGEVGRGVMGEALVTDMETQLRTYDDYVPAVSPVRHRRAARDYELAYADDYVPVTIRHHCDQLLEQPLSLCDMPVAVDDVCALGVPRDRVRDLAIELDLGGFAPVLFVETMRYAPAALIVDPRYSAQPDFVQWVRNRRSSGTVGYPLALAVSQQLRYYNVDPQMDIAPPSAYRSYRNPAYTIPQPVQNYVTPVMAQQYVPQHVRTRMEGNYAAQRTAASYAQAPAVAVSPQVQRVLNARNGAVVTSPGEARRELRGNRFQREAPLAAPPPVAVARQTAAQPEVMSSRGRGHVKQMHGHAATPPAASFAAPPVAAAPPGRAAAQQSHQGHGNGNAGHQQGHGNGNAGHQQGHGHGNAGHQQTHGPQPMTSAAPPPQAAPPAVQQQPGRGHGQNKGHGHEQQQQPPAQAVQQQAQQPAPQAAPQQNNGKGHENQGQQKKDEKDKRKH